MSETKPKNPQAFPVSNSQGNTNFGMTLLDYFAGKAMQAFLTHENAPKINGITLAQSSYLLAQAMLQEREKHL